MGTGWRRAFCTTIPRDKSETEKQHRNRNHHKDGSNDVNHSRHHHNPSPKSGVKLGLFSSVSNPSTPRAQQQQQSNSVSNPNTPTLRCRTFPDRVPNSNPKPHCNTNPSSPRSPFSILKNTLRLSRNGCGVCMQSVKTGQGMAIYTAECSHAFHFPCIAAYVRKQGILICPVCNITWKDVPLLSFHKNYPSESEAIIEKKTVSSTTSSAASAPATPTGTNRIHFEDKRIQSSISSVKTKLSLSSSSSSSSLYDDNRSYNDDEPLLSPTSGARFNPIPESEEEGTVGEDSEEFQGFFVNPPTPKKKNVVVVDPYRSNDDIQKALYRNVEVKLLPEAAVVSASRSYETYAVALRVKAPPASAVLSPTRRAPVDLVTVLDVSGSMTGPKLQMLKRAMRLVISSLSPADRLSIVAFAATPQRLLPLKRMTAQGQKAARRLIDQLACAQGTCVSEALKKAARVLEDRREKNPVASIMLLSDGQDDRVGGGGGGSNSNQRQGSNNSTRFAHIEIPVHSSGYGYPTQMPAEDAFSKCVGGLLSVVVQDLRIQLGFASGSAPAEIMAVYSCNSRPSLMSCDSVRLGDLYAEEEREILIELKVPTSAMGSHHVMAVRCSYKDPVSQEPMVGRERALLVPRPHAVRSSDPRIERLRNLFICTRAVAESRRLVDHGDFTSAHHLLASARALVLQSAAGSSPEEYARGLEAELAQVHWRRQYQEQVRREKDQLVVAAAAQPLVDENGEPLTPTSAWRAAERLAKVAILKKSLNRSASDLHGFENARF